MQTAEDILATLSRDTIQDLFKAKGLDVQKKVSRSITTLIQKLEVEGVQSLINSTKIVTLKEINEELGVDLDGNPGNTRPPYLKRWKEAILEQGLIELLSPLSKPNIEALFEVMQMDYDKARPRDELLQALMDEIRLDGLQIFLSSVDRDILLQILSDLDIGDVDDKRARSALVTAIVTGEMPEAAERTKVVKKISKTKPKLSSKISYEDCFQWYSLEELQEYARDEEIKVSGTKKEVINRIIEHLKAPKKTKKAAKPEVDSEEESAASASESESEGEKENAEENVTKRKADPEAKKAVSKNKKSEKADGKNTKAESDEETEAREPAKEAEKANEKKAANANKKNTNKKGNNKSEKAEDKPKKGQEAAEESESESEDVQELEGTVKAISIEEKPVEAVPPKNQKKNNNKKAAQSEKPESPIIKEGAAEATDKKSKHKA